MAVRWTPEQDHRLIWLVEHDGCGLDLAAERLGRSVAACRDRYRRLREDGGW